MTSTLPLRATRVDSPLPSAHPSGFVHVAPLPAGSILVRRRSSCVSLDADPTTTDMPRLIPIVLAALLACAPSTAVVRAAQNAPSARLLKMVKPSKSREATRRGLAGRGLFFISVDVKTGQTISVNVAKSTGYPELDKDAIDALKQWRFNVGAVRNATVGVVFAPRNDVAQFSGVMLNM